MFAIRSLCLIVVFGAIYLPCHGWAQESEFTEYEVKAGFIYNFAKFVEWPSDALPAQKKTVILCVTGTDPFGQALGTIDGKIAQNRKLEIRYMGRSKDLKTCNMLFVSSSEKDYLPEILAILRGSSTFTIGDTKGYARQGIMINFVLDQNRVRFEINTESARRARLTISSQLLKLAKTIYQ